VHLVLAAAAVVTLIVTLVVASLAMAGRTGLVAVDRLILATLVVLALAVASGALPFVAAGPPRDILHYVYAVAAPVSLLAGRFLGTAATVRRRAVFVAVGAAVALALVARSFMTAGAVG
jgi:hypothetical protein